MLVLNPSECLLQNSLSGCDVSVSVMYISSSRMATSVLEAKGFL